MGVSCLCKLEASSNIYRIRRSASNHKQARNRNPSAYVGGFLLQSDRYCGNRYDSYFAVAVMAVHVAPPSVVAKILPFSSKPQPVVASMKE